MATSRQITRAEVKEHNKSTDLWVIIHDKVYDVTKFLNEHPGGSEVLEDSAGKDATKDFDLADHSELAKEQLKTYFVGDIVDAEKREKSKDVKSGTSSNGKYCAVGISALAIALGSIILFKGFKMSQSSN